MVSEKLSALFGREVAEGFETACGTVLAEADALAHNPIDGCGIRVDLNDRLRTAAVGLLMACGFLRKVADDVFAITDLGSSAYERPEKSGPVREKTFTIPADKMVQIDEFMKRHQAACAECRASAQQPDFSGCANYMYTFRPSGLGDNIHIVCDCGEKFYPDAGDDML